LLQWNKGFQAIINHTTLLNSIFLLSRSESSGSRWMSKIDLTILYHLALKKWDIFLCTINWSNKDSKDALTYISVQELRRKNSILIPNHLFLSCQILQQWDLSQHHSIFLILDIKILSYRYQSALRELVSSVEMILD
jgi:hypothetical protein